MARRTPNPVVLKQGEASGRFWCGVSVGTAWAKRSGDTPEAARKAATKRAREMWRAARDTVALPSAEYRVATGRQIKQFLSTLEPDSKYEFSLTLRRVEESAP